MLTAGETLPRRSIGHRTDSVAPRDAMVPLNGFYGQSFRQAGR